jgi:hypothetical protein
METITRSCNGDDEAFAIDVRRQPRGGRFVDIDAS